MPPADRQCQSSSDAAFTNHLIDQIRSNLDLLLLHSKISRDAVNHIKTALPSPFPDHRRSACQPAQALESSQKPTNPAPHGHNLHDAAFSQPQPVVYQPPAQQQPTPHSHPPPHPPPQATQPHDHQQKRAKALWSYRGTAPDDLNFEKGDIIIVLAEENEDWWKGHILNSQVPAGLFPSNHVEVISGPSPTCAGGYPGTAPAQQSVNTYQPPSGPNDQLSYGQSIAYPHAPPARQTPQQQPIPAWQAPPYQPGYQGDMKHGHPAPQYVPPPPMSHTQSAPTQVTVEHPKKKPLQGRLGQALVGGAGFGAGSAVATHVVNAIL